MRPRPVRQLYCILHRLRQASGSHLLCLSSCTASCPPIKRTIRHTRRIASPQSDNFYKIPSSLLQRTACDDTSVELLRLWYICIGMHNARGARHPRNLAPPSTVTAATNYLCIQLALRKDGQKLSLGLLSRDAPATPRSPQTQVSYPT